MKKILVLTLILVSHVLSQSVLYVDQNTQYSRQDGSLSYPYSTLEKALLNARGLRSTIQFLQKTYTITQPISFTVEKSSNVSVDFRGPSNFTLIFDEEGAIICQKYIQPLNQTDIKNVQITISDMNIVAQSSYAPFNGSCNFILQNIFIDKVNSTLIYAGYEGNFYLKNFTISDIRMEEGALLIDHDSKENLQADYLILEQVSFSNSNPNQGVGYAIIKSFIQYRLIQVYNSYFKGIGFNIKGEQIGGNVKTTIDINNVTMEDSVNFLFIESFLNANIKNSLFRNASQRAVFYFLTDENLSPNKTTIENCTFINNRSPLLGAAITFQASKETNRQFNLSAEMNNLVFNNNSASINGGAVAFLSLRNGNIALRNSTFISSAASESGGAIYMNEASDGMSIQFTNNNFDSNSAFAGGVFYFEFLKGSKILLQNNTYTNNSATFEGGIGVLSQSSVALEESNSIGKTNSAKFKGGSWSFEDESNVYITNSIFENSDAFLNGGCIYSYSAILNVNNTTFTNCSLSSMDSSGGAIFVGIDSFVNLYNSNFVNNQAQYGAAITILSQSRESHILNNLVITSALSDQDKMYSVISQLEFDAQVINITRVNVPGLTTPLIRQKSGSLEVSHLILENVECKNDELRSCLFDISSSLDEESTFTIRNANIQNINSAVPLIITFSSQFRMEDSTINNVQLSESGEPMIYFESSTAYFDGLKLSNLNSVFIEAIDSKIFISGATFQNETSSDESDDDDSDNNNFIQVSNTQVEVTSSDDIYNSLAAIPEEEEESSDETDSPSEPSPTLILDNVTFTNNQADQGEDVYYY